MAAGDVTQGVRRPDGTEAHELVAGEYALAPSGHAVILCNPDGHHGHVYDSLWSITVEEDQTITVNPSIWWDKDATPPGWHGYLQRGVWREV